MKIQICFLKDLKDNHTSFEALVWEAEGLIRTVIAFSRAVIARYMV